MICYAKGPPPARLTALAATPGMTWAGLGADDRDPIRTALVRDQGGLCAYCQRRITADEDPATRRSQMKIEHWIPRAGSADHHLTWSNLLGVCLGVSREPADRPPDRMTRHCDTSRGDHKLFLHPVQGQGPDPREHLRYTQAGVMEAAKPDARVDGDISALNLNARHLVRARKEVLDELRRQLERAEFATSELRRIAHAHRISGTRVPEHPELVRYYVRKKLRSRGEVE